MFCLFIAGPVVELVHKHDEIATHLSHKEDHISKSQRKCKICDHFARQQTSTQIDIALLSVIHFEGKSVLINTVTCSGLTQLRVSNRSNKGPPSIIS
ncbi:MAG TPA: hypothetical protein VKB19_03555 [Pedobacter sp.]|nr:hypothetical protein [Pedobacter sp.]